MEAVSGHALAQGEVARVHLKSKFRCSRSECFQQTYTPRPSVTSSANAKYRLYCNAPCAKKATTTFIFYPPSFQPFLPIWQREGPPLMGSSAEERRKVFSRKERKKAPNAWHCYCSLSLSFARRKLLSISGEEKNVASSLFSSLPISAFFALDNLSSHFRITQFQHVVMGRPLCWITPLFSTYCPIYFTRCL